MIKYYTLDVIPGWILSSFAESSSQTLFCILPPSSLLTKGDGLRLVSILDFQRPPLDVLCDFTISEILPMSLRSPIHSMD